MFLLHFKRGTAEQTVTVKVPFLNESLFSRLAVPSLDREIDLRIGRTRNSIITDDDSRDSEHDHPARSELALVNVYT